MAFTWTGKHLTINEIDDTITFINLGFDWNAAGYTAKARFVDPQGNVTDKDLTTVGGQVQSAKLSTVSGLFTVAGIWKVKPFLNKGIQTYNLGDVFYEFEVFA